MRTEAEHRGEERDTRHGASGDSGGRGQGQLVRRGHSDSEAGSVVEMRHVSPSSWGRGLGDAFAVTDERGAVLGAIQRDRECSNVNAASRGDTLP